MYNYIIFRYTIQEFNIFIDYGPLKVNVIQQLYFPVLCNISLLLIYLIHSGLYLLIPYLYLSPFHFPLSTSNHQFSIYVSLLVYNCSKYYDILYLCGIGCYFYFSICYFVYWSPLFLLNLLGQRFINFFIFSKKQFLVSLIFDLLV